MTILQRNDLMSLEEYATRRSEYREQVSAHKRNRQVSLGPNATLYFEDRLTMQYQVQEMLRIEKIFEAEAIEEELAAYNPLIPDGSNWKATFMIEFVDETERKHALANLIGIEKLIWIQVGDLQRVNPITNEDMIRETEDKTSAVHFLRFELDIQMVELIKNGVEIRVGVNHSNYCHETGALPENIRNSLSNDVSLLY